MMKGANSLNAKRSLRDVFRKDAQMPRTDLRTFFLFLVSIRTRWIFSYVASYVTNCVYVFYRVSDSICARNFSILLGLQSLFAHDKSRDASVSYGNLCLIIIFIDDSVSRIFLIVHANRHRSLLLFSWTYLRFVSDFILPRDYPTTIWIVQMIDPRMKRDSSRFWLRGNVSCFILRW